MVSLSRFGRLTVIAFANCDTIPLRRLMESLYL
jgi:hypothetical protein